MTRIMAHHIWYNGIDHKLSIVEISDDRKSFRIMPYTCECSHTSFINGAVVIYFDSGQYVVKPYSALEK